MLDAADAQLARQQETLLTLRSEKQDVDVAEIGIRLKYEEIMLEAALSAAMRSDRLSPGISRISRVVAVGVETTEQLGLLQAMHCSAGQGWLWSQAMPMDEVATLMSRLPQRRFPVLEGPVTA